MTNLKIGSLINHTLFGNGIVTNLKTESQTEAYNYWVNIAGKSGVPEKHFEDVDIADISFNGVTKNILLKYAMSKITVLD